MLTYPLRWPILGLGFCLFLCATPSRMAGAAGIEEDIQSLDPASRSALVQEVVLKINNPPQKNAESNQGKAGESLTLSPKTANFMEPGIHAQSAWPGSKNYDYLDHPESAPHPQNSGALAAQLPKAGNLQEPISSAPLGRPESRTYGYLDHPGPAPQKSGAPGTNPQTAAAAKARETGSFAPSAWPESKTYCHLDHPESMSYIKIIRQEEDHLLITVGDVVYLSTPLLQNVQVNERFCVYKNISTADSGGSNWFEEIGQLKILEKDGQLTIGRIIAARDIIQKGDVVFLRNRL